MAMSTYTSIIRVGTSGTMTFGAGFDLTGSGICIMSFWAGSAVTDNSGTWSFTGDIEYQLEQSTGCVIPTIDARNANFLIQDPTGYSEDGGIFQSGTLYCIDFKIDNDNTGNSLLDCATNNPSFQISGDIDFVVNNDITWTKGT
jgi:hypothetical protein